MTDPERFSRRSTGLAAELLRAGADERPTDHGVQQTLLALGLSGVVLSTASAASAVAVSGAQLPGAVSASAGVTGVGLASAGTIKTVTATLIIKWLGMGIAGGVSLMGVAAVATNPVAPSQVAHLTKSTTTPAAPIVSATRERARTEWQPTVVGTQAPKIDSSAAPSVPRVAALVPSQAAEQSLDVSSPLAAEVAYVDRARALLVTGQSGQGLALLERYEREFRETRLLPEVLFLQLDAYERSARSADARRAARRLADEFPRSPHIGRARKLLEQ
ncbi:MAG TPA: hypothetical protein VJV79_01975 [Polyangiaceae bacterium]|nr:hypothetical protein [Polyangiaceae bacterium]